MEYVRFGTTGLQVSRLCLGCMTYGDPAWRQWVLDAGASRPFIKQALDLGFNFFDTANLYSLGASETVLGDALRDLGVPRSDVVIATKLGQAMGDGPNQKGLSRKHVFEQIDGSLKRLKTDYIDLYQVHRLDPHTSLEEALEALSDVVRAGKVRYLGASSMWAWQFAKAREMQRAAGWARFVSMQNYYNLIDREEEREMMPYCAAEGVAVIPWSPLARGYLASTTNEPDRDTARAKTDTTNAMLKIGASPADAEIRARVKKTADRLGVPPARVALAWVLSKPFVTAGIIGASKPHHLGEVAAALEMRLDGDTCAYLEAPYLPKPVTSHE